MFIDHYVCDSKMVSTAAYRLCRRCHEYCITLVQFSLNQWPVIFTVIIEYVHRHDIAVSL